MTTETTEFEYDHNAKELDRQLEEVMDSHKAEKAAEAKKEAEALTTEPPALDRLATTTKDEVDDVKLKAKEASVVLREEMVRDRLREYTNRGPSAVDDFLKTAKATE